jgi:hypothetical protein
MEEGATTSTSTSAADVHSCSPFKQSAAREREMRRAREAERHYGERVYDAYLVWRAHVGERTSAHSPLIVSIGEQRLTGLGVKEP